MKAAVANIGGAIIHGVVSIDDCIQKQYMAKGLWQNYLTLIIAKISMISLKLLSTIDMY